MRKNIGWQETLEEVKYQVRVIFEGGGRLRWCRISKAMERWENFEPTPEQWQILLAKTKSRYVRRQAPFRDMQLIERLAAEHPLPPEP